MILFVCIDLYILFVLTAKLRKLRQVTK